MSFLISNNNPFQFNLREINQLARDAIELQLAFLECSKKIQGISGFHFIQGDLKEEMLPDELDDQSERTYTVLSYNALRKAHALDSLWDDSAAQLEPIQQLEIEYQKLYPEKKFTRVFSHLKKLVEGDLNRLKLNLISEKQDILYSRHESKIKEFKEMHKKFVKIQKILRKTPHYFKRGNFGFILNSSLRTTLEAGFQVLEKSNRWSVFDEIPKGEDNFVLRTSRSFKDIAAAIQILACLHKEGWERFCKKWIQNLYDQPAVVSFATVKS